MGPILCFMTPYMSLILMLSDRTILVNGMRKWTWRWLKLSHHFQENLLTDIYFLFNPFKYKRIFLMAFKQILFLLLFSFTFILFFLALKQSFIFQLFPRNVLSFCFLGISCISVVYFLLLIMFWLLIMTLWSLCFSSKWLRHV